MPGGAELRQALWGAWRLALLDRGGMQFFDLSHRGVWRSFWAAPICYPPYLLLLALRLDDATVAHAGFLQIAMIETIGYIIAWCAFPLLVLALCRPLGREEEGFDFIVAYNWSQILQMGLFLATALLHLALVTPQPAGPAGPQPDLLTLIAVLAALAYEGFIALVAIGAGGWIAVAVVFIDLALGMVLGQVSAALY